MMRERGLWAEVELQGGNVAGGLQRGNHGGGIEGAPGSAHRAPRSRARARLGVRVLGFQLGSAVLG